MKTKIQKRTLNFFLLTTSFVLIYNLIIAQSCENFIQHVHFENLTIEKGLSNNYVNCAIQDADGFMWFGTADGLNKYDGYSFKVYRNKFNDKNSLSNNTIRDLYIDHNQKLWVATDNGLNLYDKVKDSFSHFFADSTKESLYSNIVTCINGDKQGNLWIGTTNGALHKLDIETHNIQRIQPPGYSAYNNDSRIRAIYIDKNGRVWFAVNNKGLFRYYPDRNKIDKISEIYPIPPNTAFDHVNSIYPHSENKIWINHLFGFSSYDFHADSFQHFSIAELSIYKNNIKTLFIDSEGRFWIGSEEGLFLNCFDETPGKNTHKFPVNKYSSYELHSKSIKDIYQDAFGNLWISTMNSGIYKYNTNTKPFYSYFNHFKKQKFNTYGITQDNNGNLWVANFNGGVYQLKKEQNKNNTLAFSRSQRNYFPALSKHKVTDILIDKNNNFWIAGNNGVYKYSPNYQLKEHYFPDSNDKKLSSYMAWSLLQDHMGNIWVATIKGLNKINTQTGKIIHFKAGTDKKSISNSIVWNLVQDHNNNIWIATSNGLNRYNYQTGEFTHFFHDSNDEKSISSNKIISLFIDSKQRLWIGTEGAGLNLYQAESGKFVSFSTQNGLPNNAVWGILEDSRENLWVSTNMGISRFNVKKMEFDNFTFDDGLQANQFRLNSAFKTREGHMVFGGENGLTIFNPAQIKIDQTLAIPVINQLWVAYEKVPVGEFNNRILLQKHINNTDSLSLSYTDDIFSLEFSALHFVSPKENKYRYKLENFDEKWVAGDYTQRRATYSNLPGGEYIFKLQVANCDGVWNPDIKKIHIFVESPFWKKNWFIFTTIIFVLFIIWLIYRLRLKRIKYQNRMLEKEVKKRTSYIQEQKDNLQRLSENLKTTNVKLEEQQEEIMQQNEEIVQQRDLEKLQKKEIESKNKELNKHKEKLEQMVTERTADLEKAKKKAEESDALKTSFLANMSHEIRTPMNAIVGFANMLQDEDLPKDKREEMIHLINQNSDILLQLINDIIDIAKLEAGETHLQFSEFTVNDLLKELQRKFSREKILRGKEALDIIIENVPENEKITLISDKIRIRQVIVNLLDNAMKFTDNGYIKFGINSLDNEKIQFYVCDTGIGITEQQRKVIFDRFRKVEEDTHKLYRGAGLGLAICKNLILMLGGDIWLKSTPQKGTTFYFTIPLRSTPKNSTFFMTNNNKNAQTSSWKGKTFLIVEDEKTNFIYIQELLRQKQALTLWARNGREAIEICQNDKQLDIDLILMDIKLPIMDGIEAAKQIKEIYSDKKQIPIIAQTAYATTGDREALLEQGLNDYLAKPIQKEELYEVIEEWLK